MTPESLQTSILYLDDSIIIVNKPADMPVHSGPGGGENLEQYLHELRFGYPTSPILAHRLDRNTSGCLILGRDKEALSRIGKLFMAGRIAKTYWAVVAGKAENTEGRIDIPIRKQSQLKHQWWMEAHPEGQPAVTDYKVIGQSEEFSLLKLHPLTGRTHQLRVHCKAIGCPIVGDKIYGNELINAAYPLMHLHARAITIPYHNKPALEVIAPPPLHMIELLNKCGYVC